MNETGSPRRGSTWQDMNVGDRLQTSRRTITETDLVGFITMSGLFEPLFMDASHAEDAGLYGGRLVPGALTLVFAEGLVIQTGVIHGTGLAFLGMELRVLRPVLVGDTIEVAVEVTAVRPAKNGGRGVVTTRNDVANQHGHIVMTYHPVRLLAGRDPA